MDPALLHQRLDMLLKSGGKQSSRRRLPPAAATESVLNISESSQERFQRSHQNHRDGISSYWHNSRMSNSRVLSRPGSSVGPQHHNGSVSSEIPKPQFPFATTTTTKVTGTPELRPTTPSHPPSPPTILSAPTTGLNSSIKKAKHMHKIRRSASIRFEAPLLDELQLQTNVLTAVHLSTSTPTCASEISTLDSRDAESTTQSHHVHQHVPSTAIATTPTSRPLLENPIHQHSQPCPHPVTPRQNLASSIKSRQKSNVHRPFPHLTLSDYKRPEEMVRLTDANPNRILEKEYDLRGPGCKVIGHGAYSTVRSALRRSDHRMVAIKSISKFDAMRARRLQRPGSMHMDEWEILRLLKSNPYTLTLLDLLEADEEIHLVTEYCAGGELFNAIKRKNASQNSFRRGRFSEPQASRITYQLLKALEEMHEHGIVHRDIKPENVLLMQPEDVCTETSSHSIRVKLADFGVARVHHHNNHHDPSSETTSTSSDGESSPLTPGLLLANKSDPPPEGCRGNCGSASDMFSLGVTLYILLCGFPPVFCEHSVQFPDAYWQDISEGAKELVRFMLRKDPEQRITATQALESAWIRQQQAPPGRRASMCANLELVRTHLARSVAVTDVETCSFSRSSDPFGSQTTGSRGKRSLRESIHQYTSPKRIKRHTIMKLPMTELYNCQQSQGGAPAIENAETSDAAVPTKVADGIALRVACT